MDGEEEAQKPNGGTDGWLGGSALPTPSTQATRLGQAVEALWEQPNLPGPRSHLAPPSPEPLSMAPAPSIPYKEWPEPPHGAEPSRPHAGSSPGPAGRHPGSTLVHWACPRRGAGQLPGSRGHQSPALPPQPSLTGDQLSASSTPAWWAHDARVYTAGTCGLHSLAGEGQPQPRILTRGYENQGWERRAEEAAQGPGSASWEAAGWG